MAKYDPTYRARPAPKRRQFWPQKANSDDVVVQTLLYNKEIQDDLEKKAAERRESNLRNLSEHLGEEE